VTALLLLLACDDDVDIPRDPGTFEDAATLRDAWLAASPNNLMIQLLLRHSDDNFVGDCPTTVENDLELTFTGGCDGEAGETWHGEGIVRTGEDHMNFVEYGLSWGGTTWKLTGEMDWSFPDLSVPDEQVRVDTRIEWSDGDRDRNATADVEYLLHWNSGRPEFTWMTGKIGLEDWGTAELTADLVGLGTPAGCSYPSQGEVLLTGDNEARLVFEGCGSCPTGSIDGSEVDHLCSQGGLPALVTPRYEPADSGI